VRGTWKGAILLVSLNVMQNKALETSIYFYRNLSLRNTVCNANYDLKQLSCTNISLFMFFGHVTLSLPFWSMDHRVENFNFSLKIS
jgi:hypothetical protein